MKRPFLVVLIALCLALSAGKGTPSEEEPVPRVTSEHPTDQSIQKQDHGDYINKSADDRRIVPIDAEKRQHDGDRNGNSATNKNQRYWWMTSDWLMVGLTGLLCLITLLQFFIFRVQYRATYFSERAQIMVVPLSLAQGITPTFILQIGQNPPTAPAPGQTAPGQPQLVLPAINQGTTPAQEGLAVFGPNQLARFEGVILNIGHTPAYQVTCDSWMELIGPPFVGFPSNAQVARDYAAKTVYPGDQRNRIQIDTDHAISQMEFAAFQQAQRELWVRIRVRYRDRFRKRWYRRRRYAEFGWRYTNVGLRILPQYQDSD